MFSFAGTHRQATKHVQNHPALSQTHRGDSGIFQLPLLGLKLSDQAALEKWTLHKHVLDVLVLLFFFFFLIFMWNYPKRLENGNIDIPIQHSLASILQPIQRIGIQDVLFESLLNFPLSNSAHSLPLLFSVRLKFLCGLALGTTLGNKITPVWMLGTFPVFPG